MAKERLGVTAARFCQHWKWIENMQPAILESMVSASVVLPSFQ
jgi:hypothetical protein